jgi:hypothetical protein
MQKIVASQPSLASQRIRITVAPLTHPDCPFTPLAYDSSGTQVSVTWDEAFSVDWRLPFLLEEYSLCRGYHTEWMKSSEEMI